MMERIDDFFGHRLTVSEHCVEYVQARTHKKKRINKKWRKKYGNKAVPMKKIVVAYGEMFMHPIMYQKIKKALEQKSG